MKNAISKMKLNHRFIIVAVIVSLIYIVSMVACFIIVNQKSEEIASLKEERDELAVEIAELQKAYYSQAIHLSCYEKAFGDYTDKLFPNSEETDQETETDVVENEESNAPDLNSYFTDINFEDGLDTAELYLYNKQKSITTNLNMMQMFTNQLELDKKLLEGFDKAFHIGVTSDTEMSYNIYRSELSEEIKKLEDYIEQCQKNLAELADYENAVEKPE